MDDWEKYKIDWNVNDEEEKVYEKQFKNIKLLRIVFPEFWLMAYAKKNNFFHHVLAEAKQHVESGICGEEWLKEDLCKELWERHCDFCWKKIDTNLHGECYCSEDADLWICADCFSKFRTHFGLAAKDIDDIPKENISSTIGIIKSKPNI